MRLKIIILLTTIFSIPYVHGCEKKTIDELSYMDKDSLITHTCKSHQNISKYQKEFKEAIAKFKQSSKHQLAWLKLNDNSASGRDILNSLENDVDRKAKGMDKAVEKSKCSSSNYQNALNFFNKEYGIRDTFWQKLLNFDSEDYLKQISEKDTRDDSVIFLEKYCNKSI